jgi:DNA-binding NarL/FixJ family response regulator
MDKQRILRVLIADDHPLFRAGVRAVVERMADGRVVGEAGTGREAAALALELAPDIVLMDLHMPEENGIEASRRICATTPAAVIVLTMLEDDDSVFAALKAGARGYLLKGADEAEIVSAIRVVGDGGAVLGPAVASRTLQFFITADLAAPSPTFPELTDRERKVLELLATGKSNAAIAATLYLSQKTVRNYVSNIFTKLHIADRAEAIIRAREAGLGT